MSLFVAVCVTISIFSASGCATIFTGTRDRVTIESVPPGAEIFVDGYKRGVTPSKIRVKRSLNETDVELRLDGYQRDEFVLDNEFNPVSVVNLLCLICWAVDAGTGAMMRFDRKSYERELVGILSGSDDEPTESELSGNSDLDESKWERIMLGMPPAVLLDVLGHPDSIVPHDGGKKWTYGNGYVTLSEAGGVDGWRKP